MIFIISKDYLCVFFKAYSFIQSLQTIQKSLRLMLSEEVVGSQLYLKKELIGNGGFARCYLLLNPKTGQKLAGKVIRRRQLRDKGARAKVLQEIEIHRCLNHQNVVRLIEVFDHEGEMYIVMELCHNNSMKEFLKSRVRLTEFQAKCYILQLIQGLEYLHGQGIVHRDIKLGNVFLSNKMQVKIGDFGLSAKLTHTRERRYTTCGTPNYIAPQILAETGHGFEVDIWALGIILYALLVGKPPFESETVDETYKRIRYGSYDFPKQIPLSAQSKGLIKGLLDPNPKTRFTLSQVKCHDFLHNSKVPALMPPYTISIPPQNSYLKQWVGQKPAKLSIYPRKVSQIEENSCTGTRLSKQKFNRVLSCDKNVFKLSMADGSSGNHSILNRGVIFNTKMKINLKEELPGRGLGGSCHMRFGSQGESDQKNKNSMYEEDGNQIICYYDVSTKYGIGYLLSNGSCGVVFNDETSLTTSGSFLLYFQKKKLIKIQPQSPLVKKKMSILQLCTDKLKEYKEKNILIPFESQVFVKKFTKTKDFVLMKLSNGLLQFFWSGDSVTVRGYKWVRWRIDRGEGEGPLMGREYPAKIEARVAKVREFLKKESQRSQMKREVN